MREQVEVKILLADMRPAYAFAVGEIWSRNGQYDIRHLHIDLYSHAEGDPRSQPIAPEEAAGHWDEITAAVREAMLLQCPEGDEGDSIRKQLQERSA